MNSLPHGFAVHPTYGDVAYRTDTVSWDPDTQVAQTIGLMRGYVLEDVYDPYLLMDAEAASYPDPINGVWGLVRSRLQFTEDEDTAAPMPIGDVDPIEVLIRPRDISRTAGAIGDCDDFAMWTAALLEANGIPCAFCTAAADGRDPSRYSHVYVVAYPNGQRCPMDTSHGQYPGWESPVAYRKREWQIRGAIQGNAGARECDWLMWLSVAISAFSLYKLLTGMRA